MHILTPSNLTEIILSAGSIGSPHILLNSGIGDSSELTALGIQPVLHLPDVGKNLTDHPRFAVNFFVNSTDTMENIYFRNATFQSEALEEWQANRTGFLSGGVGNQAGFLRIPDDADVVDGEPCAGDEAAHYELIFSVREFFESISAELIILSQNGLIRGPVPDTGNYFSVTTVVLCPLSRMFSCPCAPISYS